MSERNTPSNAPSNVPTDPYPELAAYPMVLTVQEVAELLRVSDEAIRQRCLNGSIRFVTLGNRRRIPRSEVLRLLTES